MYEYNLKMVSLLVFVMVAHLAACESPPARPFEKAAAAEPLLMGVAHVYDGDSIFFGSIEVRLDAIDAPERDQACLDAAAKFWPCGIVSRDVLRAAIGKNEVKCAISGKDKYRRLLGICYVRSQDLNALMVQKGYAIAYHHFSEKYASEERQAKTGHFGIWQDASFTEPYFCRHFKTGHTCYKYDYMTKTGRVPTQPLTGKSHAIGAPD